MMPADELTDFGRLVELHYRAVVAVAYATTRDVGLAEDIAQDTFVAAWGSRDKLRDPSRVRPWLCSIARNQSRNALRGRRREVAGDHDVADPQPSIVDGAVEREASAELHAALAEVPITYREPLVLFYWEQKSIAQVASALAITEEAAQKRISRGRSYLRDGLEAPLEGESRGRRTAAAAAAAVLAILATRGAAQAAAANQGARMLMIKVFALVGLAGLIVGTVAVVRGGASDAAGSDVAARPTPTPPASAAPAPPVRAPALPTTSTERPPANGAPLPASGYEITVLGPTSVEVNLAGGKSDAFLWEQRPTSGFSRHITGRVVDAANKPVAGAVVVVGERLSVHMESLGGAGGAVTHADGTFDVTTHDDTAAVALAMHPRGWSSVVSVPAGRSNAQITLVTPSPGSLAIHVRQAGAPREADLMVTPAAGGLTMVLSTDARGELAIPLLAPGAYHIRTWPAQMFAGGTSASIDTDVTVVTGRATEVPVALSTGALVAVSAFKPGMAFVKYFLYAGTEKLEIAELEKRGRSGAVLWFLLGGQDSDRAAEFHDIAPGTYTLCVDAAREDRTHRPVVCRELIVPADQSTLEVTVEVPNVATSSTP